MSGAASLAEALATLSVSRRPGSYTYVSDQPGVGELGDEVVASIVEDEGTTLIVSHRSAVAHGWPVGLDLAWLTIDTFTSLEMVGLTAVVANALAEEGLPCNVLAGFHHDHLLVPAARADDAIRCIEALRNESGAA